ncbi:MAG: hypothetical protein ACHREM_11400 [Polyangiales bacterium]
MARLSSHLLRELDNLNEADATGVLFTIDTVLQDERGGGIVIILARGLWLATPDDDEPRLFVALNRLAARAFVRGDRAEGFATIVDLLCVLGRGQSPLPDEWGAVVLRETSRFGWTRTARLITRWMTGFDSTPVWLRDALHEPSVVAALSDETLLKIVAVAPGAVAWRSLARRRDGTLTLPVFRRPSEAYEELERAIAAETSEDAQDVVTRWLAEVLDTFCA